MGTHSLTHSFTHVHAHMQLNKGKEKIGQDLQKTVEEARKITDTLKSNFGNLGRMFQGMGEESMDSGEGGGGGEGGEGGEGGGGDTGGAMDVDGREQASECTRKRVDFVLQEATIEVGQAQSYISAIAAHTIYFESSDVVR